MRLQDINQQLLLTCLLIKLKKIETNKTKNRAMCRNCCAAKNIELLGLKFGTTFLEFTQSQLSGSVSYDVG